LNNDPFRNYCKQHPGSSRMVNSSSTVWKETFNINSTWWEKGWGTPHNGLYGEALLERGIFSRLQV